MTNEEIIQEVREVREMNERKEWGTKRQVIDDITTARAWAELVKNGGCTAKVLEQASQMIGRLHNAERLLDMLTETEREACGDVAKAIKEKELRRLDVETCCSNTAAEIEECIRARSEGKD